MESIKTVIYCTSLGKEPFSEWLEYLEIRTKAIVLERLNRIRGGNFGACKPDIEKAYRYWIDYIRSHHEQKKTIPRF
jgi:putative component of toxin-antitoxin plasmid stabilization module